MSTTNWFRDLLGFDEQSYPETKQQLSVRGGRLIAPATGASYDIGTLEIPSLAELRAHAAAGAADGKPEGLYLTELGGGAFGNDPEWIHDAIRRALRLFARSALDVRLVSYGTRSDALEELGRRSFLA